MIRNTITAIVVASLPVCSVYADGWYVGGMYGTSHLNYDVEKEAYKWLATDGATYSSVLQLTDGKLGVDVDNSTTFSKFFIGHRFNKYFSVEVFHVDISNYVGNAYASTSVNANLSHDDNASATGYAAGSLKYKATADMEGPGVRINGHLPINNNWELLGGFSLIDATSTITTRSETSVSYSYSGNVNGNPSALGYEYPFSESAGDNQNVHQVDTDTDVEKGIVPAFALGVMYNINEHWSIRGEWERIGHPVTDMSIDAVSVGAQFTF